MPPPRWRGGMPLQPWSAGSAGGVRVQGGPFTSFLLRAFPYTYTHFITGASAIISARHGRSKGVYIAPRAPSGRL